MKTPRNKMTKFLSECLFYGNSKFSKFDNIEILSSSVKYILATRESDGPIL